MLCKEIVGYDSFPDNIDFCPCVYECLEWKVVPVDIEKDGKK